MSYDRNLYLENPDWRRFVQYAEHPPNGGHYKRWVQGSVGMMEPQPLFSNEYSFAYLKHGQNKPVDYRGNIHNFSRYVTPELKQEVDRCNKETGNVVGCGISAIRQIFTEERRKNQKPRQDLHPFGVSYDTGFSALEHRILPNSHYQD